MFFPLGTTDRYQEQFAEAIAMCGECSVRSQCLEFALSIDAQYGIFGGTTPEERRRIARRLAQRGRPYNGPRSKRSFKRFGADLVVGVGVP